MNRTNLTRINLTRIRAFHSSIVRNEVPRDTMDVPSRLIGSREQIEIKRKQVERRYAEAIRARMVREKAGSLEELKEKLIKKPEVARSEASTTTPTATARVTTTPSTRAKSSPTPAPKPRTQASADRAGVKPLSQILNLPLIYSKPHPTSAIETLWNSYHSTHPTLSPTFLSAGIPPETYRGMISAARGRNCFVLPLPRGLGNEGASSPSELGEDRAPFEMFFLQWVFHPTPSAGTETETRPHHLDASPRTGNMERLECTSVMFTPLEEYKRKGEWAQPSLVLTHYPDLFNNPVPASSASKSSNESQEEGTQTEKPQHHPLILMRGEITPSPSSPGSSALHAQLLPTPSSLSLSTAQAQLLVLALQRFYCARLPVKGETPGQEEERERRARVLERFGQEGWEWGELVRLAFGGVV